MDTFLPLIPLPDRITRHEGGFLLTGSTRLQADPPNEQNVTYLQKLLENLTGVRPSIEPGIDNGINVIRLRTAVEPGFPREGYRLDIQPSMIEVTAASSTGAFHAIQTLRQLLPTGKTGECKLPCLEIEDWPRFAWRGFMLDEARHFQGKEQVLRLLDILALFKMNIFHWHLTDDQGWRIEIKKYPRLTEVGGQRAGTRRYFLSRHHDGIPHQGFYTREEIHEIVAYAAERHITVVPEIEMPGHCLAVLAAYPKLGCTGGPYSVQTGPGISADIYCAGREEVFHFLEDVLEEVMALFPGKYIHIGGDEAPKKRWETCPACRQLAVSLGCKPGDLQVYFSNRMTGFLQDHQRTPVGWSEVLKPGLSSETIVQYWLKRPKEIKEALRNGRKVVISSFLEMYLDHSHALTSLRHAYEFEPVFKGMEETGILGLEAPLWSEFVWNQRRLDYQVFPRLLAYAETGWSARENKNYPDFEKRLENILPCLEPYKVLYAPKKDWNPAAWRQLLGIFSVAQAQKKTAVEKTK